MVDENEEKPKISKTEEKESFLKALEKRTEELKQVEENIKKLVERNEELAARNLIGGKSDAGIQQVEKKELTPKEYANAVMSGKIKFSE